MAQAPTATLQSGDSRPRALGTCGPLSKSIAAAPSTSAHLPCLPLTAQPALALGKQHKLRIVGDTGEVVLRQLGPILIQTQPGTTLGQLEGETGQG